MPGPVPLATGCIKSVTPKIPIARSQRCRLAQTPGCAHGHACRTHHTRRNLDWLLRKKPAVPRPGIEAVENIAAARGRSTAPSCALDDARLWQVGETTGKPAKTVHYKRLRGRATGYALSESAKQLANPSLTVFTRWQATQSNIYSQYQ